MRSIYSVAAAIASSMAADMEAMKVMRFSEPADFTKPKRRRTGKTYPHSSTRQRARYSRQIAAGQIRNAA